MPDGSKAGVVAGPGGGYLLNKARTSCVSQSVDKEVSQPVSRGS